MINLATFADTLTHKKVAVFGLGLSGLSTVGACVEAGLSVVAWDDNVEQCNKAKSLGATIENIIETLDGSYDCLVLSPGVPLTHPKPHPVVLKAQEVGVEILGDLEMLHRSKHGLKTIGITGTNGKSTTTALMAHVLNESRVKALAAGNIGTPVLDLNLLDNDVIVIEISSYQMDLCPTFRPDISIVLNITPDHLDRHGDMDGYTTAKAYILEGAGVGVIGVDDEPTKALAEKKYERTTIPVSVYNNIDGVYVHSGDLYSASKLVGNIEGLKTLKGLHNAQNIACVYAATKQLGLSDEKILNALKTYGGLPHRQYYVRQINDVDYINDSKATNAEAASKALASYDGIHWIVGGRVKEGGLLGLEELMPRVKKAYLIGEAAKEFKVWCDQNNVCNEVYNTLDIATLNAHKDAQKERRGTVLLAPACASWDQFESFEKRGDAFMDVVNGFKG